MKNIITFLLSGLLFIPMTIAEQAKQFGRLEVHYSAINSTFIPAMVAKQYGIHRSKNYALLNISVLDTQQANKPAIAASISGKAKNLLGTSKPLDFKEIKEGKAIYYLAEIRIANEENLQFDIDITTKNKGAGKLRFNQTFYTE